MTPAILPNNLPLELTSFIGREREAAEVARLLATARLLTLTGAGGCGKTRLALEVAGAVLGSYPDGVWLVELAPLADPGLVPQAVATVLGVREAAGRDLGQSLADFLRERSLLLILDNCEHLVEAVARLADALLRACPRLGLLATSREALGVPGELPWRVPSLSLPIAEFGLGIADSSDQSAIRPAGAGTPPQSAIDSEAVRLFVERAAVARPGFGLDAGNVEAVVQICRRLDGIPLAIELAAARVRVLTPEQIAERLDDRFRLLTGGARTAMPRQQTLRALVDWSYDLLSAPERNLLDRLSVFAGGWTLEAAEAVGAGDGIAEGEVLDLLTQLADKSLVVAEARGKEERYRLSETIRQYARETLVESREGETVRDRHRDYFLALAEVAEPQLRGREQLAWIARLALEQDNLRAALDWSLTRGATDSALRLAGAQGWFWYLNGDWTEGRAWLDRCLSLSGSGGPAAHSRWQARALSAAGRLAVYQTDIKGAQQFLEAAIRLSRSLDDRWDVALALVPLGTIAAFQGRQAAAGAHHREAVALFRETGDKWGTAFALGVLGFGTYYRGDTVAARAMIEESQTLNGGVGDQMVGGLNSFFLGALDQLAGNFPAAEQHLRTALEQLEDVSPRGSVGPSTRNHLATVLARQGRLTEAVAYLKHGLRLLRELGAASGIVANSLTSAAIVVLAGAEGAEAATGAVHLLGAAAELSALVGYGFAPADRAEFEHAEAEARAALGEEAFAAAWQAGRALTLEQALAEAERVIAPVLQIGEAEMPGVAPARPAISGARAPHPAGLSEREVEVLRLVARGLTSAQVAEQLVISAVTVSTHLRNIYGKIGVGSRSAATRWAVDHRLV
jgi:non-specific serine/threonine protein kinase